MEDNQDYWTYRIKIEEKKNDGEYRMVGTSTMMLCLSQMDASHRAGFAQMYADTLLKQVTDTSRRAGFAQMYADSLRKRAGGDIPVYTTIIEKGDENGK